MSKYKPYPKYKKSGVEWLGDVPEHWEIWKLFHAFNIIGSGTTPTSTNQSYYNGHIPWVTTGELREKIILDTKKKLTQKALLELSSLKLFPKDSILMAMYGATIGRLGKLGIEATTNQACCAITSSSKILNDYLYYWLLGYRKEIINLGYGGGQPNISQDTISNLKISAPNIEEQKNIIFYLDQKTKKIDTLIEKQQTLIKLLKEKRQAVISHAVTKGLDGSVEMKDSGVAWLGDVPLDWKVKPLRYLGKLQNGISKGKNYFGSGFPFINYGDIYKNMVLPYSVKGLAQSSKEDQNVYSVRKGDVFFTRTSETIDDIGMASTCLKSMEKATFSGFTIRFRQLKQVLDENFSKYYFRTGHSQDFFEEQLNLVTRASLGQDILKQLPVLLPPLKEQKEIANYLDQKTKQIDTLITKSTKAIELLKERRTALISAVVTGKIDVQNA